MKVIELYNRLCEIIPQSLSCSWDSDGLESCPEPCREVKRILIVLDATGEAIDKAAEEGVDVILCHHPRFFGGNVNINATTLDGARAVKLVKNNIALMSFHTRLDALSGGVNDILAARVGLENVVAVGEEGIVRIGTLREETDLQSFAKTVKQKLSDGEGEREAHVVICSADRPVKHVAVLGGSGSSDISVAAAYGADTYLTGELKHSARLEAYDYNVNLLAAGHFFTEAPVCDFLEARARDICPEAEIIRYYSNTVTEI